MEALKTGNNGHTGSLRIWGNSTNETFSTSCRNEDDEQALKWAALERLPTYSRLRRGLLTEKDGHSKEIDIKSLGLTQKRNLLERLVKNVEEDNEKFLLKLKDRTDRVGLHMPTIEVRFEHLSVEAEAYVGSKALPTLFNFLINYFQGFMNYLHILPSRKKPLRILNDISGIIKPQRLTLLLGPPSSGKTTFLLALAGKLSKELKFSGRVTYNGHEMEEFVPQRTSAYVSQYDLHIAEMTVRETLAFSSRCQGVGTRYEMLEELSRREKAANIKPDHDIDIFMKAAAVDGQEINVVVDYILKILGLEACADTMVGDEMRRGISGGEKRRVTIGEMLVGPARALFMDEISAGLDSTTTFQIVNSLRQLIHILNGTALISLLQPAPETYELFDDVILLTDGQIVYQGPRGNVLEFFEHMGFRCPERKGVADFLQEVTSRKDQEQYWARKNEPRGFVSAKEFAEAFQSFHIGRKLGDELANPFDKSKSHPAAVAVERYGVSKKELLKACVSREFLLMKRNSFAYIFKMVQLVVRAFIITTIFLRTEMHQNTLADCGVYFGALFFSVISLMLNGVSELSMTVLKLPVFYKQRDHLFFPSWAYALPAWVLKIPITFIEVLMWVIVTYYAIGYDRNIQRVFKQYLILIMTNQMASSLFRLAAALGRNLIVANTIGVLSIITVIALGGFVLPRDALKKGWIWGYWSSPMMYAQIGISVNEFLGKNWNHFPLNSIETLGVTFLKSRAISPKSYWYWIAVGALTGYTFLFNFLFTLALKYLNPFGKPHAVLSAEALSVQHDDRIVDCIGLSRDRKSSLGGPQALLPLIFIVLPYMIKLNDNGWKKKAGKGNASNRNALSMSRSVNVGSSSDANKGRRVGLVLPFQPRSISFDEITYSVNMPKEMKAQGITEERLQILKGVSGAFRPGILTALMGASGAGKTTLLDVLAGRKTGGYIEGSITISGHPKKQETFARISGYCEQADIHSPNVTVLESLVYSAWLRLPTEVKSNARKLFIEEVMNLVELSPLREALVGLPGVNGLSVEQRKRLTIAVELVANPSIIFMDEPTSGLDARAAAIVMRTVRNTVDTGRTVVCTIHQPSIDIFDAFDELLLLKRGGEEIYAGPIGRHAYHLIRYFEGIKGVPGIKDGYNPATWMLEVTTVAQEATIGINFTDIYRNSQLYRRNKALIEELSRPPSGSKDLYFPTRYSQPFLTQCMACLWKHHRSYWRNPPYSAVRLLFTTLVALMMGTIFWDLGSKRSRQQDILNAMGSMYVSVLFLGYMNTSLVQPIVTIERTVIYRERAAGFYSALPYAIGQVLIELPYVLVQTIIYGVLMYAMIGFEWTVSKCFWFLFFMYFTFLYFSFYGMMTVAFTPNHNIAAIVSIFFFTIWSTFSGFVIPLTKIPKWWRWYYWACPVAWTLYGLIASQYGDIKEPLDTGETIEHFLKNYFGFRHDFIGIIAVALVGFNLLFGFIFAFSIKAFNFQKR